MIEYRVNKDKGVVCAFMKDCNKDFVNYVYNATAVHRNGHCAFMADLINSKYLETFPDRFVAVAKCNPETGDVFDEKFGKEVAKAKLLSKYYNVRGRFIRDIFQDIQQMSEEALDKLNDGFFVASSKLTMNNDIIYAVNQGYNPTDPDDNLLKYIDEDSEDWVDIDAYDDEEPSSKEEK